MVNKENRNIEPLWYKDAVIYELHVKSFNDANGDGIGDFEGLIQKLDYLQAFGVTAIWLLPFYPSPLRDDGYDIADYFSVNKDFGTLGDFRKFLREAHKRNIRVITELVINHTSDQHKWFQRARKAKEGSPWRDYYVWSRTPDKYKEARIIFKDFEQSNWSWDQTAQAYYWHRFYSHQPDLNFDNPSVRKQILRVLDFWLDMGVDGLRLDAVPYLFEREGTNCENLPETHNFLKELRAHVDSKYQDKMLLAEANQWPEDAADYFGNGDECHMAFHFPVMPRLFMSLQMENRFPIVNMLEQSMDIPADCQWTMFLRNHDELTLEMVTDEERDYMYRAYAQDPKTRINLGIRRRLAPLLDNARTKIELMNFLLFSLPGTPVLYYGDEIGMGDNYYLGDRDGVRTPMQWSPDRNAGFSKADPQQLFLPVVIDLQYHYTAVNVENQMYNSSSLLWFMRRLIAMRNRFKAFGRGSIEFITSDNAGVLSFIRSYEDQNILVVANLSRFCQVVHLNLAKYNALIPEEVFGGHKFPGITDQPYVLTLGPHNTYWFILHKQQTQPLVTADQTPRLKTNASWKDITQDDFRSQLEKTIVRYLEKNRRPGGKGKQLRAANIKECITVSTGSGCSHLLAVNVSYPGGQYETYLLAVSFAARPKSIEILNHEQQSIICQAVLNEGEGIIYDAAYDEQFRNYLLGIITRGQNIRSGQNRLVCNRSRKYRKITAGKDKKSAQDSKVLKGEQSNTSILYGDSYFLKLYRRVEGGINPDAEISKNLTEYTHFTNFPAYVGSLEWQRKDSAALIIGLLLEFVPNEGDAWTYTLDSFSRYLTQAATQKENLSDIDELPNSNFECNPQDIPQMLLDIISPVYIEMVSLLGKRTAELHLALASLSQNNDTAPEPFSILYQKSVYQSMRALTLEVFGELESSLSGLKNEVADEARQLLSAKQKILERFRNITARKIQGLKIRIHGDYHLGQVLYTGKDFIIIDFEGEPARSLSERRLKQSALRDVAGMMRSFHYAAYGSAILRPGNHTADSQDSRQWTDLWYRCVSKIFLGSYLAAVGDAELIPKDTKDIRTLLDAFLLEKAIYEVGYELNNRPDWLIIAIKGTLQLLK
ncbi:MAG: maltose alpha-D-glucosyltransferase [Phycisphaerae bacterium]